MKISARKPHASVKIIDAALEERNDFIVLRGVIDPESLNHIQIPDYQRGVLVGKVKSFKKAIKESKVPDVELAVRGGDFITRDDAFYIHSPTFVLDGLQRLTGARNLILEGFEPYIGCTAYFNTTPAWERERFRILNAERVPVSPNVLLRNIRTDNPAIRLIYDLTRKERSFVLHDRIAWGQNQKRTEVLTALVLLKTVRAMHAHFGGPIGSKYDEVAVAVNKLMDKIGRPVLTHNIITFFNVLDECWSIRNVVFTQRQSHLKGSFLFALADVYSRHLNFWEGPKLKIDRRLVKKIGMFPLQDPSVQNLSSASGKSRFILMEMIIDHINSGKRTGRLKARTMKDRDVEDQVKDVA